MQTCFNPENDGNLTGKYPLFLGQDLGFMDTINVTYPEIEELYQLQIAQLWNEKEYFLDQDRKDLLEMDPDTRDVMVKTIMWQWLADSVASRSIVETLAPFTSNSEMMNLLTVWSMFEVIHGRSYSHIVRQAFEDPNALLEEAKVENGVLVRSGIIAATFNDMNALVGDKTATEDQIKKQLVKTVTALLALEAIAFMASFACTFAITETGKCQGIGNIVKAVCKDEVLHTRMDYAVLDILVNKEGWGDHIADTRDDIKAILDEVVTQEMVWSKYIFSEGRKVLGLNETLLSQYVQYMAKPLYDLLGVQYDFEVIQNNPLPYMEKYIDPSSQQTAAQELELTSYRVAATDNDIGDDELDF